MSTQLDDIDRQILNMLQSKDMCSPKINKCADNLDMPASTVHSRVKRLEEAGYIDGYSAKLNCVKIGKPLTVFFMAKLEYPKDPSDAGFVDRIAKEIAASDSNILEVHTLTGEWELLIKAKLADYSDYHRIFQKGIIGAGGGRIQKLMGITVLSTMKEGDGVHI